MMRVVLIEGTALFFLYSNGYMYTRIYSLLLVVWSKRPTERRVVYMVDNAPSLQQKGKLPTNKRKWVYAVCCMASMFCWTDEFTFSSTMPYWQAHFSLSVVEAASIASMYTLFYAMAQIYGGVLGDMFGPKKILLITIAGVGVTCLGILFC
jgi:nitrate/nitrite transporter NarK